MNIDQFNTKTAKEEYNLISSDDSNFTKTKRYLKPLISTILNKFKSELSEEMYQKLMRDLIFIDIPIATERFLSNKENRDNNIKFSIYFTWYIAQRLNPEIVWCSKLLKKIKAIFR